MTEVIQFGKIYLEDLALGNGSDTVTLADGTNATLHKINGGSFTQTEINVKSSPYNAVGNGIADDSAAIMAAIVAADGGTVDFPDGTYAVQNVLLKDFVRYRGVGWNPSTGKGSVLKSIGGAPIFTHTSTLQNVEIDHLLFTGAGGTAIKGTNLGVYNIRMHVHDCSFDASLAEGIYDNLIEAVITHNEFGYFGSPGAAARHIYSFGNIASLTTNVNTISHNRFTHAVGPASVYMEAGYSVNFVSNIFESNNAAVTVRLAGMYSAFFTGINWFEHNAGAAQVIVENDVTNTQSTYVVRSEGTFWALTGSGNTCFFVIGGAAGPVDFIGNTSTSIAGKYMTYNGASYDVNIGEYINNHLMGYTRGNSLYSGTFGSTGTAITGHLSATKTWAPGTVALGTPAYTTITVTGAALGDSCVVGFPVQIGGSSFLAYSLSCSVTSANTVGVILAVLDTGGSHAIDSNTLRVDVWKH